MNGKGRWLSICPKCRDSFGILNSNKNGTEIICYSCGCEMVYTGANHKERAIKNWNTRVKKESDVNIIMSVLRLYESWNVSEYELESLAQKIYQELNRE